MEKKQPPDEDRCWPRDLEYTKLVLEVVELALRIVREIVG